MLSRRFALVGQTPILQEANGQHTLSNSSR